MLKEFYKNKKILITGHTGFKGSWLSQILLNLGVGVVGYALEPNTQPALFDILGLAKNLEHHIGDIRDYQNLKKIILLGITPMILMLLLRIYAGIALLEEKYLVLL